MSVPPDDAHIVANRRSMGCLRCQSLVVRKQRVVTRDVARHMESIAQMAEARGSAVRASADEARRLKTLAASLRLAVSCFRSQGAALRCAAWQARAAYRRRSRSGAGDDLAL